MDAARSIVHSVTHYIKNTDLYLMLLGLVCSIYGMFLIYSATLNPVTALDGSTKNLYVQGAAIILGLAAFIALSLIDLENLGDLWKIFVIGNILLQFLLFTPLGTEVNGQRAWLNLGVTSLQPGELGKLIFIFTIAAHMTEIQDHITEWRGLVSVGLHTLVMMGAVVLSSGDTGMAIQYLMIAVIMLFSAGLPLKWLGIAAGVGIASVPILWNYVLKDYQKTRILVLFDPSIDVEQSRQATYGKIAIGSGQFTGQGWTNGTMTQMQYVPENQTDYIFSVAGEELGFLGCLLIIILLMALIIRLFYVAYRASTPFSALIAVGVSGMLLFQTFMNIFMNVGLLHDIDFEQWPEQHCVKASELLREGGADESIIHAVCSHGWAICVDIKPEHEMEKLLYAADELTGLIGAAALMRPSKSVQDMELKSLKKKYKDKKFAAGCSREVIERGAELCGLTLEELWQQTLDAMRSCEDSINRQMEEI